MTLMRKDKNRTTALCWRAQPNDLVGGWCVTLEEDPRTPAEGAAIVVDQTSKPTAQYIATLHNYVTLLDVKISWVERNRYSARIFNSPRLIWINSALWWASGFAFGWGVFS